MKSSPVTVATNDYLETLDRILDKGIVVNNEVVISRAGVIVPPPPVERVLVESISIQPHGFAPMDIDDLQYLFPYWRRDFWTK
ncbi:MAG TPA: gas vesicle protein GvpJ [Candidatus Angelobacter sp.]